MKKVLSILLVLAMVLCGVSAFAEEQTGKTFVTPDGVLSIQAPDAEWQEMSSPGCWFVIADSASYILIDHLSNGEAIPPVSIAGGDHAAVYQAYISTRNEIFTVLACSADEAALPGIIQAIGTIQILTPNTKTALSSGAAVEAGAAGTFYNTPFAVYAEDGTVAFIVLNADKTFCVDRLGNHYSNVRGDLYYCIELDKLFSADPNYWIQQQSEAAASAPFTVYPLDGDPEVIHLTESGKYVDELGGTYTQTANILYLREDNGVTYSADPDYWNYDDMLAEKDAAEAAASAPFTVYPLDGDPEVIHLTESGKYADELGGTYTQTANGLYVRDDNGVAYSANPDYWNYDDMLADKDAADEIEQNARELDEAGETDTDTLNSEDDADEIARNARELDEAGETDTDTLNSEDDADEIAQHAQELEESGEVNPDNE